MGGSSVEGDRDAVPESWEGAARRDSYGEPGRGGSTGRIGKGDPRTGTGLRREEKSVVEKHRDKDRNREGHKTLDGERQTEDRGREKTDRRRAGRERKNRADSGRTPAPLPRGSHSAWPAVGAAPPAPHTPVPGGSRRAGGQGDCKVAAGSPQRRGAERVRAAGALQTPALGNPCGCGRGGARGSRTATQLAARRVCPPGCPVPRACRLSPAAGVTACPAGMRPARPQLRLQLWGCSGSAAELRRLHPDST
nr:uncharacterized protein LOC113459579 [Zonotrichia albicollis]